MTEKKVKFSTVVKNQFPGYIGEEYPLSQDFFSEYYKSQEYQGATLDILENIDQYVKLDKNANIIDFTNLIENIDSFDTEILVENTEGFPESYGLIKIDDEIITYTGKTSYSFTGCIRGFSGITSYFNQNNPEQLVFSESEAADHNADVDVDGNFTKNVVNLSTLFLKEFFRKTKYQIAPGFEDRSFYDNGIRYPRPVVKLNQSLFVKQLKDFYSSRGTDLSFEILFKALYNEKVKVIKPRDYLFRPSDAHYLVTKDIVVEKISGNPFDLRNSTLFQNEYGDIKKAYAPITKIEKISTGSENSEYYKLSLDSGYDRDIIVDGAIYGEFSIHPTTKSIGNFVIGSTTIDVDSTVGFPSSGSLRVLYNDGSVGVVTYTSKSLNQFFGCTNIVGTILDKTNIGINTYAFGKSSVDGSEIRVRITPVLEKFNSLKNSKYIESGDIINIKTLGIDSDDPISNSYILNISPTYDVEGFSIINTANNIGLLTTKTPSSFKIGDRVSIIDSNNTERSATVADVKSERTISIVGQGFLPSNATYKLKKNILKSNVPYYPLVSSLNSNVQSLYKEEKSDGSVSTIVASPSIPSYQNQPLNPSNKPIIFSGTYPPVGVSSTDIIQLNAVGDHGLYTGDAVYYTPEKDSETGSVLSSLGDNFVEGLYFVKRLDQYNIKLSRSRSNIFNNIYVQINSNVSPNQNKIEKYDLKGQSLESQKLLREISPPTSNGIKNPTLSGQTGILVNGVEILNYKSSDTIYYGAIEQIDVVSPGQDYDVINPPLLHIEDITGVGATGYCSVSGFLQEVRIVDPGFDYTETPIIRITGGNGNNAVAVANMKLIDHSVSFNSDQNANNVGVGTTLSNIGFGTYHKFRNGERVIYDTNGQLVISGLVNKSAYYVSTVDSNTIKIHQSEGDAIAGINTISLLSYGIGNHTFKSFNKKSILSSVQVVNPGFGYENKKRTVSSSGINTSSDLISIKNHGFESGEIIKYVAEGTEVEGLNSGNEYYVSKLNDNSFRLSLVGSGSTTKDFYYTNKQYIDLRSVGFGTHVFNYPDIKVEVIGTVGISSVGTDTFRATIQPIFRGQITSVHVSNSGVGYGSSEIINFHRDAFYTLKSGRDAVLKPIVSAEGKIVEVLINQQGSEYFAPPNLEVIGDGIGAVVTPVLSDTGKITAIKILESGLGYSQSNTFINVVAPGRGAEFKSKIQSWTINNFARYVNNIQDDDGILTNGLNENLGLQYSHVYAPRKLREILYSTDQSGKTLYGISDLRKSSSGEEVTNSTHSPIIGWAYDGNPIYGPYGYEKNTGGSVKQLKSGYVEESSKKTNRPPLSVFPPEFFVEDFTYVNSSDDLTLDENNGRFCVTPEFPDGTYAYFATVNSTPDSSGTFSKYKRPIFPYLIGKNYYSNPIEFNFKKSSNQDSINLNKTNWKRNIHEYQINLNTNSYDYIHIPKELTQQARVKFAAAGTITNIGITSEGNNYKVGDSLVFNNDKTKGFGLSAEVSRLSGKKVSSVSVASSTLIDVEFYPVNGNGNFVAISNNPHSFVSGDIVTISGLSTTNSSLEGSYVSGISTGNTYILNVGVGSTSVTGLVTYFQVTGDFTYPNLSENDILTIEDEKVKVLNVDFENSRIRVLRGVDSTVGSSHTNRSILSQNERKIKFKSDYKENFIQKVNRQLYFNPSDSVAIGTQYGVGIGSTIIFSNPGFGDTQIFIPTKSIYIQNHNLNTGDVVIYSSNGGSSIGISTNGITTSSLQENDVLYIAKLSDNLIGISTVKVGLGSTGTFVGVTSETYSNSTLYFTSLGDGVYHSFKTNHEGVISGNVSRNLVTVSTAETHGLRNEDFVYINVNPSISTSINVTYNDSCRRILINPRDFDSSGISTTNGTITIQNHGYYNGEKVVHSTLLGTTYGLNDNEIYYVIVIDKNRFKLANTYNESISNIPTYIGVTSSYSGKISQVNPQIKIYRDSTVSFNLSDPSLSFISQANLYSAFELNFYTDGNFIEKYDSSRKDGKFNVLKYGSVGISSDARVELTVNKNSPEKLFYKLDLVNEDISPESKRSIIIDDLVKLNNQLTFLNSNYSGKHNILVASTNSFTYTLPNPPEEESYTSTSSIITYETDSPYAYGGISSIRITNNGSNYYSLPGISTEVVSNIGRNALFEINDSDIGLSKTYEIKDIGFDFPADFTLRPNAKLPQICTIDPLSSFESIGVSSFGRGYISPPSLVVIDGKTGSIVPEVDLVYELGNNSVEIRKNTYGINNVEPIILPVNNSNGVGISSIGFNPTSKDVTVTLSVGFSTANSFPFSIGDRVLIEGVSVGIATTAKGYNSKNYNYSLFTITSLEENIGGIGTITYNLTDYIGEGETPGLFDSVNSSGRIIAEKHFIKFTSVLKKNSYIKGENILSPSSEKIGLVGNWNEVNNQLKVESNKEIKIGDILTGESSFTQGIVSDVEGFDSDYDVNYFSIVKNGWENNTGFLGDNLQRIQDNDYYQKFSYSLRSRVDYDTWNDPVSSLNHTSGFKKFGDLQMESAVPIQDSSLMVVSIPASLPEVEVITDIIGVVNLNCVYDFDLARENVLSIDSRIVSDEIIFENRILTDYSESVGNRVLMIDNISDQFNSYPRPTKFSEVSRFYLNDSRTRKYITYVKDRRYVGERQLMLVTLLYDEIGNGFINQYARLETQQDLGSFDFYISGTEGVLTFYPNKFSVNDYNVSSLSYNLKSIFTGIGSTNLGNSVIVTSSSTQVSSGSSSTIVSISTSYTSAKVILEISGSNNRHQYDEFTLIHDGSNIEFLSYGQLTNHAVSDPTSGAGLGTYYPYFSGNELKVDFHTLPGIAATVNTMQIAIGNSSLSGVGTITLQYAQVASSEVSIAASVSPVQTDIVSYPDFYDGGYFILQISDISNNAHQVSEIIVIDDYISGLGTGETYYTEFGNVETSNSLGTVGTRLDGSNVVLTFEPLPNIDVEVKCYYNTLAYDDELNSVSKIDLTNSSIETDFGIYTGTESDVKRSFNIQHNLRNVFQRDFLGNNSSIVNIEEDSIRIDEHFFVTGEEIIYTHSGAGTTQAIGIGSTTISGIGLTDKLPSSVYIIKVNDSKVKLASSATNALASVPIPLDIVSVGIGTSHTFTSKNQNQKVIISIDNNIQSPIVSTALTTTLANFAYSTEDVLYFSGITSFFGGDLVKINEEIMRISAVGVGSTNSIRVRRGWMGTVIVGHSTGSLVTKVEGNYNIVNNTLNFVEAPYGNIPLSTTTNPPDERDWSGITTHSTFQGRVFLRSGVPGSSNETYHKNYIFDDISSGFDGYTKQFTLKSNGSNVTDIENENSIILINDIFQGPGLTYDYNLSESVGITSVTFTGTASSVSYDPNNANIPVGGIIVSVGSTEGFGYQPLISAGGTATVSVAGSITNISIGNSGSGYRGSNQYEVYSRVSEPVSIGSTIIFIENTNSIFKALELNNTGSNVTVSIGTYINSNVISVGSTYILVGAANTSEYEISSNTSTIFTFANPQVGIVNVSVGKTNVGISTLTHVGIATILNGYVVSPVYITNNSTEFSSGLSTITYSPYVVFDSPLSYSNIPLVYSSVSSGVGTQATIDIVVGQGSSVIDFEINNTGYGYGQGQILTIPIGGITGIPTTSNYEEFQITIQKTYNDKFTGWSIGQLQVLDNFDSLFDSSRKVFPITLAGNLISIRSSPGSNIDVQATLLIFINDILQVPGEGYIFDGGSTIEFTEAPKPGDTSKILFYKGSGSIDVIDRNILETIKIGDELTLGYDASVGQTPTIQEESRTVTSIESIDLVETNPYYGPGNITDETLLRPIVWCRQTEDKIINETEVGKDRQLYEPSINPFAYLIKSIGIGSTVVYVDNLRPFFNPQNENDTSLEFQNTVTIISQDSIVSASATAVVSTAGTISSVVITDGGFGYSTVPTVSIAGTSGVGFGTTTTSLASAVISGGNVISIAVTSPGLGYTTSNPPQVLISPPTLIEETSDVVSFFGDSGIIVGFGTTSIGASKGFIFDLTIPENSYLRDSNIVGTAVTLSGISSGDYFVVYDSNVGSASTFITSLDNGDSQVAIGTSFIDNVYEVNSTTDVTYEVVGIGTTTLKRVYVKVDQFNNEYVGVSSSNYFGSFSWGKIILSIRNSNNTFNFYGSNGVSGISTSTIVSRKNSLKYKNYIV